MRTLDEHAVGLRELRHKTSEVPARVRHGEMIDVLRSLDAAHLATARVLGPELTGLATYDDRLAAAGQDAGLEIVSPRA